MQELFGGNPVGKSNPALYLGPETGKKSMREFSWT